MLKNCQLSICFQPWPHSVWQRWDHLIDYPHRLLRFQFDRQQPHEAYIQTVLCRTHVQIPPDPEGVTAVAAVLCEETPSSHLKWFVLEDAVKPIREFEEISLTSPLPFKLMATRVGIASLLPAQLWEAAHQSIR
jgi:hypothetical protein